MAYSKPFPRIFLINKKEGFGGNTSYLRDSRAVSNEEQSSLNNAFNLLISDFIELTDYVEPVRENSEVFSHRIFELFVRASTEFEAHCRGILLANNYRKKGGRDLNVNDYYRLNSIMKLSDYKVITSLWRPREQLQPLSEWSTSPRLSWYHEYNLVKHNRSQYFKYANLGNLLNALTSLVIIYVAQFNEVPQRNLEFNFFSTGPNSVSYKYFQVFFPSYSDKEKYDFIWEELSKEDNPFDNYNF